MSQTTLSLPLPTQYERFYKFTILTPHTFLPPDHSASLEDEMAEQFAEFLRDRVAEVLGARSYTPHRSGEAFLNTRFDEFEEKFLRHSEYAIFITSGTNAACLDLIYPRMLVFLTIRPTWRNRAIVVYIGPPAAQKLFDSELFATEPLIFSLQREEWDSPEGPWNKLLGTLQTKVPLTPEPTRKSPIEVGNSSANKDSANGVSQFTDESEAEPNKPIRTAFAGTLEPYLSPESIRFPERGLPIQNFASFASSFKIQSSHCQREYNLSDRRSYSSDDMCLFGNLSLCQGKNLWKKEKKERRHSEPSMTKRQKHGNSDILRLFGGLKTPKKKRLVSEPILDSQPRQIIVQTPEFTRVSIQETNTLPKPKKTLRNYCLQVQNGESPLDRSLNYSTQSFSPSKRRNNTSTSDRQIKPQCDSGIVSNFSVVSTDITSSSPSLCDHTHFSLGTSPTTFLSSSLPSCLGYPGNSCHKPPSHEHTSNSLPSHFQQAPSPSIQEKQLAELKDSPKFIDDDNPDDETSLPDERKISGEERFLKPGLFQSESWTLPDTVNLRTQNDDLMATSPSRPTIMNPNSGASSDSFEDPTLVDDSDAKFHQDIHGVEDDTLSKNCEEQRSQISYPHVENPHSSAIGGHGEEEYHLCGSSKSAALPEVENFESKDPQISHSDQNSPQERIPVAVVKDTENDLETAEVQCIARGEGDEIYQRENNRAESLPHQHFEGEPQDEVIVPIQENHLASCPVSMASSSCEHENESEDDRAPADEENPLSIGTVDDWLQIQLSTGTKLSQPPVAKTSGDEGEREELEDKVCVPKGNGLDSDSAEHVSINDEEVGEAQNSAGAYSEVLEGFHSTSVSAGGSLSNEENFLISAIEAENVKSAKLPDSEDLTSPSGSSDIADLSVSHSDITIRSEQPDSESLSFCAPRTVLEISDNPMCLPFLSPIQESPEFQLHSPPGDGSEDSATPHKGQANVGQVEATSDSCVSPFVTDEGSSSSKGPSSSAKSGLLESSLLASDNAEQTFISRDGEGEDVIVYTDKRHSPLFDATREPTEIVHEMLKKPAPETLQMVRFAVKTYDQHGTPADPTLLERLERAEVVATVTSPLEATSTDLVVKQPTHLRRIFPALSVAILNLSTAYIPRYLCTIYDYFMVSLKIGHPDSRLREFTTTLQETFVNNSIGVPLLLAGTTILSPWVLRQFPLTLWAACRTAPDILSRLIYQPGTFLAEHFSDISEVFQTAPTWTTFVLVGSRGNHWRLLRPS